MDLDDDPPTTYIVPSAVVAFVLKKSHEAWGARLGRKGQKRNVDNPMRRIQPAFRTPQRLSVRLAREVQEKWELLEQVAGAQLATSDA